MSNSPHLLFTTEFDVDTSVKEISAQFYPNFPEPIGGIVNHADNWLVWLGRPDNYVYMHKNPNRCKVWLAELFGDAVSIEVWNAAYPNNELEYEPKAYIPVPDLSPRKTA